MEVVVERVKFLDWGKQGKSGGGEEADGAADEGTQDYVSETTPEEEAVPFRHRGRERCHPSNKGKGFGHDPHKIRSIFPPRRFRCL